MGLVKNIDVLRRTVKLIKSIYFTLLINNGNSGASKTIDFSLGNNQIITISENTQLTLSAPGDGSYFLKIINGGAYTITWVTTINWAGKAVPSFTASGYDWLGFKHYGTTWDCGGSLNYGTV